MKQSNYLMGHRYQVMTSLGTNDIFCKTFWDGHRGTHSPERKTSFAALAAATTSPPLKKPWNKDVEFVVCESQTLYITEIIYTNTIETHIFKRGSNVVSFITLLGVPFFARLAESKIKIWQQHCCQSKIVLHSAQCCRNMNPTWSVPIPTYRSTLPAFYARRPGNS